MAPTPVTAAQLGRVARFVAAAQRDPTRHIGYLEAEPEAIAEQLAALEPDGLAGALAVWDGQQPVALLATEHEQRPPRVWWHGPVVAEEHDGAVLDELYAHARRRLPATVVEEELAPDDRNVHVPTFAARHGFTAEEASAVLAVRLAAEGLGSLGQTPAGPRHETTLIAPLTGEHRDAVAALHDASFPATHTTGADLAARSDRRTVLVALEDATVVGYVAAERQRDASGYLDFLAVAPRARGRGVGRRLVVGVWDALAAVGCPSIHLTVRETNQPARALYASLGFREERLLRPWRRGFSLAELSAAADRG